MFTGVIYKQSRLLLMILILLLLGSSAPAQKANVPLQSDSLIAAAREIIGQLKYCVLVTVDSAGRPNLRTMNPFPPEKDMTIWMATNSRSRKVSDIQHNPSVCLYYADLNGVAGYVSITGMAYLVDDMNEKLKRKREYWNQSFPDWKFLVLIKVVPERMEVLNYRRGALGDNLTWKVPTVQFKPR